MNKTTKLLIGLFVILAVVAYFMLPSGKERETSYKTSEINFSVDSAMVSKIEIQLPSRSVVIENTDGKWMITSPLRFPANASTVTQLISSLAKFRVGSLISSNPEKQNMFQVDSTGTKLSIAHRSGKPVSLVVGKMGPSYSEVYVRLPESNNVYLGEGLSTWMVNQELREWRDKTILTTNSDSIKEFSIEYKSKSFAFQRDSTRWMLGKDTVAAGEISSALSTLSNLHADDFIDSTFSSTTKPLSVKIHTSEDVVLNFFPLPPDSAKYAVQTSRSPQAFVLSKWSVQQVKKPIERFLK